MSVLQGVFQVVRGLEGAPKEGTREVVEKLLSDLETLYSLYPIGRNVYPLHIARVVTAPAYAITRVTFYLSRDFNHYVKKVYVDAASHCRYRWYLETVWGMLEYEGNEHEFTVPHKIAYNYIVRLEVTNEGSEDQELDLVIDGFSRYLKGVVHG